MQDEIRQLPLRDCKPVNKKDPNKKKHMQVLDPADSSFLVGPNAKKGKDDDDKMQVDNALVYSLESKDIIDRAIKKKPITDVYDLKYLKEVMHRQENRSNQVFREQQKLSFNRYSHDVKIFVEGKHVSNKSDIGAMAGRIAQFEED